MIHVTVYNEASGRFRDTVYCPELWAPIQCGEGEDFLEGKYDTDTHYVQNGESVQRPELSYVISKTDISADGTDVAVISQIPVGSEVFFNGERFIADGSDIEFVTDTPGEYRVKIDPYPYKVIEVFINAT